LAVRIASPGGKGMAFRPVVTELRDGAVLGHLRWAPPVRADAPR
jgi:hypothetical protein